MSNCFIILAAGKSNRFISKIPKPYIKYKGDILINHSINKAILSKKFSKIVVAINKAHKKYIKKLSQDLVSKTHLFLSVEVIWQVGAARKRTQKIFILLTPAVVTLDNLMNTD